MRFVINFRPAVLNCGGVFNIIDYNCYVGVRLHKCKALNLFL